MTARLRSLLLRLHRTVGLSLALFLLVAGLTGSVAAFHDALDAALNPDLFRARTAGPPLPLSRLLAAMAAAEPRARLGYVVYRPDPGRTVRIYAQPRPGPHAATLAENELFLDPATGVLQGRRPGDGGCCGRRTLIPFLYRFHYTLGLGHTGRWVMGIASLVWSIDCVVGLLLTLPLHARPWRLADWRRWGRIWRIKPGRPGRWPGIRLAFDLHRAVSLWLWLVLLGVAVSGVALALPGAVFRPAVAAFLPVTPPPAPSAAAADRRIPGRPIDYDAADAAATRAAAAAGWRGRPGSVFALPGTRTLSFFFADADGRHAAGLGAPVVLIDSATGAVLRVDRPGHGRAGDLLLQFQLPWHGGRLLGLPGRILIALTGLVVPMLVVTGVIIWHRKRRTTIRTRHP